jgi:dCMP deaminase
MIDPRQQTGADEQYRRLIAVAKAPYRTSLGWCRPVYRYDDYGSQKYHDPMYIAYIASFDGHRHMKKKEKDSLVLRLCRIGWHMWSKNYNGIRLCKWCSKVDRYFGVTGYRRKEIEKIYNHRLIDEEIIKIWLDERDLRYMMAAAQASKESTCMKKQLGCVLVTRDGCILKGANGPPYPLRKCDPCPRLENHNGTNIESCRAVHAERQTLLDAARLGIPTAGSRIYSHVGVPCKDCMLELIAAGVTEIVVLKETYHDELSMEIVKEWSAKGGKIRVYDKCEV